MRKMLYLIVLFISLACSAKKTPSESPITIEQLLESAWKDYGEFRFGQARASFYNIVNSDAENLEAYYGLSLSSTSLGFYNEAYSYGITGTAVGGENILELATGKIVLDNNNYSAYYDTLKISGNNYVFRIKLPHRNIVNIISISKGNLPIIYDTYYDSLIIGQTTLSELLKPGDTIVFSVQITPNQKLNVYKWHLFTISSSAYYFDGKLTDAKKTALIPAYRDTTGSLSNRVRKKFSKTDLYVNLTGVLNGLPDYILLAHILNKIDNNWPNNSIGWNCGTWQLSTCDIKWVLSNINHVKNKYYQVISQP